MFLFINLNVMIDIHVINDNDIFKLETPVKGDIY